MKRTTNNEYPQNTTLFYVLIQLCTYKMDSTFLWRQMDTSVKFYLREDRVSLLYLVFLFVRVFCL